jgi:hypothetical protein
MFYRPALNDKNKISITMSSTLHNQNPAHRSAKNETAAYFSDRLTPIAAVFYLHVTASNHLCNHQQTLNANCKKRLKSQAHQSRNPNKVHTACDRLEPTSRTKPQGLVN